MIFCFHTLCMKKRKYFVKKGKYICLLLKDNGIINFFCKKCNIFPKKMSNFVVNYFFIAIKIKMM